MIELRPIGPDEGRDALAVFDAGARELWGLSAEEIRQRYDPLDDLLDPASYYRTRRGAFLVLVDAGRVVGTGGLAGMSSDTAELKRLWVLPGYRGCGLGRRLLEGLLVFARAQDYRRVWLEVATPEMQGPALKLYRRVGFRPIPPYREGPCELAMERTL